MSTNNDTTVTLTKQELIDLLEEAVNHFDGCHTGITYFEIEDWLSRRNQEKEAAHHDCPVCHNKVAEYQAKSLNFMLDSVFGKPKVEVPL